MSQHFEQLELGRVCFLTSLLHMVADVDFLQDAVILRAKTKELRKQQKLKNKIDKMEISAARRLRGGYILHITQQSNGHYISCNIHNNPDWK